MAEINFHNVVLKTITELAKLINMQLNIAKTQLAELEELCSFVQRLVDNVDHLLKYMEVEVSKRKRVLFSSCSCQRYQEQRQQQRQM